MWDIDRFRICRFCGLNGYTTGTPLMQYGVRHYAHTPCLIRAKGEEFILGLPIGWTDNCTPLALSEPSRRRLFAKRSAANAVAEGRS